MGQAAPPTSQLSWEACVRPTAPRKSPPWSPGPPLLPPTWGAAQGCSLSCHVALYPSVLLPGRCVSGPPARAACPVLWPLQPSHTAPHSPAQPQTQTPSSLGR